MNTTTDINEYVDYNEKYAVLICRPCEAGIPPSDVKRHLREEHKSIPIKTRNAIVEWSSTLTLCEPEQVATPPEEEGRIPYLEFIKKGFRCSFANCNTYRTTEVGIEKHCNTHGWKTGEEKMWEIKSIQRFFKGYLSKYFFPSKTILMVDIFLS